MRVIGSALRSLQSMSARPVPRILQLIAILLCFPCFKASHLLFKVTYLLQQRRALLLSCYCGDLRREHHQHPRGERHHVGPRATGRRAEQHRHQRPRDGGDHQADRDEQQHGPAEQRGGGAPYLFGVDPRGSSISPVAMSTIILARWAKSRGRFLRAPSITSPCFILRALKSGFVSLDFTLTVASLGLGRTRLTASIARRSSRIATL